MPKDYGKSMELCAAINADACELVTILFRRLSIQFEQHQIVRLNELGYAAVPDTNSFTKDGEQLIKVNINAETTVYISINGDGDVKAYHRFSLLTQPAHVDKFVAAIARENNGWGNIGSGGLMYRGYNIFELYTGKSFNDTITELIRNDQDLRVGEHCEECKACQEVSYMNLKCGDEAKTLIREAFKQCRELEMLKPDAITSQEVYLGYVPERDVFLSAWDVFGSHNTGCVLIEFAVSEDGRILSSRCKDSEWDQNRQVDEICDASDRTFYDKKKSARSHGPNGGDGRSFYDIISGNGNGPGHTCTLIDIRLD